MTQESKIICRNQFKNTDEEARRAEFNRLLALLISRMDNQALESGEKIKPLESAGCFHE